MGKIYTFNDKIITINNKWAEEYVEPVDPYNPLGLPANTIRVKFKSGYTPSMGDSQNLVDSTNNVWDIYKESNNWGSLFANNSNLTEIIGANTTNVTNMDNMFRTCRMVQSGALALYQQVSSQANPPSSHNMTFYNCGADTTTGAAELAQIPSDWKY